MPARIPDRSKDLMMMPTLTRRVFVAGAALVAAVVLFGSAEVVAAADRPNIVFIVGDDLGWGDLGCYGQQIIRTPNIDRLARDGMRFTRHYAGNPVCAPSRCVLMTGKHSGHAFIRDNRNFVRDKPGQHPIPAETVTFPKLLKQAGYATGAFGKWGLGAPDTAGAPQLQGIDRFFGYNCQGVAHNFYPTHLWDNTREIELGNPKFAAHQELAAGLDPNDAASYRQFTGAVYSADRITDEAIAFLRARKAEPFLLFVPSTIPHMALQVPEDSVADYEGKVADKPYVGERRYLPHRTPRACYAGMVSRLDRHVGMLMATLDELGLAENTIVVFTSDNGPVVQGTGGADTNFFHSGGDLRGRKGSVYEGGVRVPLIVRWPGKIAPGSTSDRVCGFEDWLPTLLELTGNASLAPADIDGVSLAPTLLGQQQPERPFMYREFPGSGGQQAVWQGRWKAVRQNLNKLAAGDTPVTELYDLSTDPNETTNVAAKNPAELGRLEAIMRREHAPSEVFPITVLDGE